jgi:exonuclease VII small subunit
MNGYTQYAPPAPGPAYDERNYGPDQCETAQEPLTNQLTNRLNEAEKFIAEIIHRASKVSDKLFGPTPIIAKLGDERYNDAKIPVPVQRSMMDQLLVQSNQVNRKLSELSDIVRRLESL